MVIPLQQTSVRLVEMDPDHVFLSIHPIPLNQYTVNHTVGTGLLLVMMNVIQAQDVMINPSV